MEMLTSAALWSWLARLAFVAFLGWHVWLLFSAMKGGARFSELLNAYPLTSDALLGPRLGGLTPGSGILLPFGAWFETAAAFREPGMFVEYKGEQVLIPWEQLRLFGAAPLIVVVEVVPQGTKFAFNRLYFSSKVLRRLRASEHT